MDYSEIDRVMMAKSLSKDPAFEDVSIAIQPIPCFDGCPLGLYYPDRATIVLPPDATQAALLHELGHRHGHYYYDDLSERYAEHFRMSHQKGRALLYLGNDFSNLSKFGAVFEEGEKGAVEVALLQPLARDELYQIKSQLYSYGEIPKIHYGNSEVPVLRVEFTKGVDWLVIIGATMAASVLATIGVIGYAVYKVSKELPWIVPVGLLGTGMFFLLRAMAREVKTRIPA